MTSIKWQQLKKRLQTVANNKNGDKYNYRQAGVALIAINLLFNANEELIAWYKPERINLEPKTLDWLDLNYYKIVEDWDNVIDDMQHNKKDRILIIKDGLPIAWYSVIG